VVDSRIWLPALISGYILGFIVVTDRIAIRSFAVFQPALGEHADRDRMRAELTSLPDRLTLGVVLLTEVVVSVAYFTDANELAHFRSLSFPELASILIANWISIGLGAVLVVHTGRQLLAVDRLHRAATNLDLYEPGPTHAFARLTAATGVGIVIVGAFLLLDPAVSHTTFYYAGLALGVGLFATAAFALPLRGMNLRLSNEKQRLLHEVNERIKALTARIHASVDSDELTRSDRQQQALASLIAERDLIGHLSTWPWSSGTIRGFASALLLPIVLFLITRALERVV
jgi:hypothetical protein